MKWSILRTCQTAGLACLVAVLGCGGDTSHRSTEVVPVSGVVTYKGVPVEGAAVTFHPAQASMAPGATQKPAARAKTDAQGKFRLWTFDLNDGAVPGEHTVTISKVEIVAPDVNPDEPGYVAAAEESPPKYLVPQKYGNQRTSGLKETVAAEGTNEFEFALAD